MLKGHFWKIVVPLLLLYIAIGDSILPESAGSYSRLTRQTINSYLVSLFPDKEVESPYGRNDELIEKAEEEKRGR